MIDPDDVHRLPAAVVAAATGRSAAVAVAKAEPTPDEGSHGNTAPQRRQPRIDPTGLLAASLG